MVQFQQPVEGVFLDIGWTMNAPAGGDWLLTPYFHEAVPRAAQADPARLSAALGEMREYLDENHRIDTEEEEYRQFFFAFGLLSELLPELEITARTIGRLARDKVYNDDNYLFFDDVPEALERLRGRFRLGIISDTWPSIDRVLRRRGLRRCFDTITYSFALGVCKPDPRLYAHALRSMSVAPGRCVFVDDDPGNLEGARRAGIQPALIDRRGNGLLAGVRSLTELCAALGC